MKPARDVVVPGEGEIMPPSLPVAARAIWDSLAPDLIRKKVLTHWDVDAFARYCLAVVRVREAERMLQELGEVHCTPLFDKEGNHVGDKLQKSPWMMVWTEASAEANRLAARFGLTPSDRNAIKISHAPTKDANADFLSG